MSDDRRGGAGLVVAVMSGGLDSTVLVHHLLAESYQVLAISFDYGQRHRVELQYAQKIAAELELPHVVVDLRSTGSVLTGSALTDDSVEVPDGHYADATMAATVVPNRNAIFAMIAGGHAVASGAQGIALGVHAGDHFIYPDCRPPFIDATETLLRVANEGFISEKFAVLAPFLSLTKADIVRRGHELGVDFASTWSCYRGADWHCGRCGTCIERKEAFAEANVIDPTHYDPTPDDPHLYDKPDRDG